MLDSNFVDYVKIYCCSGKGGAGCLHFHREKFNSKGGPDGGNGGQGGHVIIRGDSNMRTLQSLKYRKHISAEDGQAGQSQNQTGSDGKNIILDVPIGTVARHADTEELICEIVDDGKELILFKGGRGGKGNTFFATPTNRTPQHSQPGEPSIDGWVILELKLLADVGLVGFPNAGKSTLLSVISAAKPKIADYAFTTLVPSLGIVKYRDNQSFAMADIPGIIKGASAGKGLGLRFLRHIERNALLLFVIPADSFNIRNDYEVLLNELRLFNPELLDKRRLLAISKSDLLDDELREALTHEIPSQIDSIFISSITEKGLSQLKDAIWEYLYE